MDELPYLPVIRYFSGYIHVSEVDTCHEASQAQILTRSIKQQEYCRTHFTVSRPRRLVVGKTVALAHPLY
jgi:hypothetical protein